MMRILTRLALIGVVLAMVGCGGKPDETVAPETKAIPKVTPKEVVAAMYDAAMAGDDEKVLACFDKATAAASKELTESLKSSGKGGPSPAKMFNVPGATVGEETIDGDKATVGLVSSGKPFPVELVVEGGEWKVTMPKFVAEVEKQRK